MKSVFLAHWENSFSYVKHKDIPFALCNKRGQHLKTPLWEYFQPFQALSGHLRLCFQPFLPFPVWYRCVISLHLAFHTRLESMSRLSWLVRKISRHSWLFQGRKTGTKFFTRLSSLFQPWKAGEPGPSRDFLPFQAFCQPSLVRAESAQQTRTDVAVLPEVFCYHIIWC